MSEDWYYANAEGPIGPLSREKLREILHEKLPDWKSTFVWRDGFDEWQKAGFVRELASRPPPLPKAEAPQSYVQQDTVRPLRNGMTKSGWIALVVLIVSIGGISYLVDDGRMYGVGYMAGQALSVFLIKIAPWYFAYARDNGDKMSPSVSVICDS